MLDFNQRRRHTPFQEAIPTKGVHVLSKDLIAGFILGNLCHFPEFMQANVELGMVALESQGASDAEMTELIQQSIRHLVLHEVGHTLGLNHNMKASQITSLENLHNDEWVAQNGLIGSVMDYTPINLAPKGATQGKYFADAPGSYDKWAIQFGYQPDLNEEARNALLRRSLDPLLTFGNDADDMRWTGKAIDPRVNIGDMSGDTIEWSAQRFEILNDTLDNLLNVSLHEDESFQRLVNNFNLIYYQKFNLAKILSRYIGGVYVERGAVDQFQDITPYTPVSEADQKQAMALLNQYVFAPDAFAKEETFAPYLQPQRRGYNFFGTTEDPKLHDSLLTLQMAPIYHMLHPSVLQRMEDSARYGNTYGMDEMMLDLSQNIFMEDLLGSVNTYRQHLQKFYVDLLIEMVVNEDDFYPRNVQANAVHNLRKIQGWLSLGFGGDSSTKIHRQYIREQIRWALNY